MANSVLGLGTAAMDVFLFCEDLPREDGFAFIHDERLLPGGSCANVLAAATVLGDRAALAAKMGDDAYGRAFIEDLKQSGVNADHVLIKPGGVSLHTFVNVSRNGAKAIFAHLGDSLLDLKAEEVRGGWLDGVDVFYTDLFPSGPALKLARLARERGLRVMFNLQTSVGFMGLCRVTPADIEEMMGLCDLFITFRHPLAEIYGPGDPLEKASLILDRFQPRDGVVVTLGSEGAVWADGSGLVRQPSFPVRSVDTTGAGDAFTAGLIHAFYFQSFSRQRALAFASAAAAIKCTQPGARLRTSEEDVWRMAGQGPGSV